MKKSLFFALVLFSLLNIFSCSSKKDEPTEPTIPRSSIPTNSTFSAKVNGVSWSSTSLSAIYSNGFLNITAKDSNGSTIIIQFQPMSGMDIMTFDLIYSISTPNEYATYQATSSGNVYSTYANSTNVLNNATSPSEVNLMKFDEINKKISGTFNIIVKDPLTSNVITIGNGTFTDVVYK